MRQGLLAQRAAPQQDPVSVTHPADTITLEQAALIMGDKAELIGSIRRDLAESERLIQLSDALESIADVARSIQNATPNELRLLELCGQLAVAGSDVEPDRIVPSLESFLEGEIALEAVDGMVSTAKKIWEAVLMFVRRVWEKIRNFWSSGVTISKYKKTITDLKAELQRAGDAHPEKPTFAVSGVSHGLMLDMSTTGSWEHLLEELKRLETVDDAIFNDYSKWVLERGAETARALRDFDPKTPEKSAGALKDRLIGMHLPEYGDVTTKAFLGGGKIENQAYDKMGGEDPAIALERLRLSGLKYKKVEVASTIEHGKDELHGIPAGSHAQMEEALTGCEKLLDMLDAFYSHKTADFDKTGKEIELASNAATEAMGRLDKAEFGAKSLEYYRVLINFNKAFADWANEPFLSMQHHTERVVNSIAQLVRGSMTCYKSKPE
jgi:hypothetical protein